MNYKIDPKGSLPYPTQLKNNFKEAILKGEFQDQEALPDYQTMMIDYGYSEDMIRKTYNELIREGFARRIKKRGVFVHHTFTVEHMVYKMSPILQEIEKQGFTPSILDLQIEVLLSNRELTQKFEFEGPQNLLHLTRVFGANGIAVLLMDVYYPYDLFKQSDLKSFLGQSIYPLLEKASGRRPSAVEKNLSAILITQKQADLLKERKGNPGGLIEGLTRDQNGQVIEVFIDIIPGDRFRFIL